MRKLTEKDLNLDSNLTRKEKKILIDFYINNIIELDLEKDTSQQKESIKNMKKFDKSFPELDNILKRKELDNKKRTLEDLKFIKKLGED